MKQFKIISSFPPPPLPLVQPYSRWFYLRQLVLPTAPLALQHFLILVLDKGSVSIEFQRVSKSRSLYRNFRSLYRKPVFIQQFPVFVQKVIQKNFTEFFYIPSLAKCMILPYEKNLKLIINKGPLPLNEWTMSNKFRFSKRHNFFSGPTTKGTSKKLYSFRLILFSLKMVYLRPFFPKRIQS